MKIENRFLKYISFDTQSDESSLSSPSTSKQLELADFLKEEMRILGFSDIYRDEYGTVYGRLLSNVQSQGDVIGFIAHMDTSPDCSGHNINPQIIRNYQGGIINLNDEMSLNPLENTELLELIGHDLITTDGTTLLGADDKAGISIIMTMAEYLHRHPHFKHNEISVAFTCDEEIGRGVDHFDYKRFNATYAYTIDGGKINEYNAENFNAYKAKVKIKGKSYHPGDAKNKMINALTVAREFDTLLGDVNRPEHTDNYDGFYHLHNLNGDVSYAKLDYIVREHDKTKLSLLLKNMSDAASYLNMKYDDELCEVIFTKQYENMHQEIKKYPQILELVHNAMTSIGLEPIHTPIRGGTDGAFLSINNLPTPNLGTGGYNYHGPYEFVSINAMKKGVELLLAMLRDQLKYNLDIKSE